MEILKLFLKPETLIAIAVAVFTLLTWRAILRQTQVMERLERDRLAGQKQAVLRAKIVHGSQPRSFKLEIQNIGQSTARDLRIHLDGKPFGDHECIVGGWKSLPKIIAPGSPFLTHLSITLGGTIPASIEIHWSDESGLPGHHEANLSLPA